MAVAGVDESRLAPFIEGVDPGEVGELVDRAEHDRRRERRRMTRGRAREAGRRSSPAGWARASSGSPLGTVVRWSWFVGREEKNVGASCLLPRDQRPTNHDQRSSALDAHLPVDPAGLCRGNRSPRRSSRRARRSLPLRPGLGGLAAVGGELGPVGAVQVCSTATCWTRCRRGRPASRPGSRRPGSRSSGRGAPRPPGRPLASWRRREPLIQPSFLTPLGPWPLSATGRSAESVGLGPRGRPGR